MDKYSIFHLEGGLGKNVAATAVAKCIKNNLLIILGRGISHFPRFNPPTGILISKNHLKPAIEDNGYNTLSFINKIK